MDRDCYVYIVAAAVNGRLVGPVKVGITDNIQKRLSGLQTGHPHELQIAAQFVVPNRDVARDIERAFHVIKASHRLRGEWFDLGVVDAIRSMCINIRAGLEVNTKLSAGDIELALLATGVTEREANLRKHGYLAQGEASIQ